jgi:hypothetical protein
MSLISPNNAREVGRSGWLIVPLFIIPMIVTTAFWRQVYVTVEAVMKTLPFALTFGLLFGLWVYRRSARLVKLGLHPYFNRSGGIPMKNTVAVFAGMILIVWVWSLMVVAGLVFISTTTERRIFQVSAVEDCNRKCNGCPTRVKFSNWIGTSGAQFCAEDIAPRPHVGSRLAVRGTFNELIQYVQTLEPEPQRGS